MIRAAQIQDVANLVAVLHASIRSCIQDHQRNEAKIQAWLENKSYENILMLLHYNNCWVYVLQHVVVGFIMISDRGQILQHAIAPEVQQRGIGQALLFEAISDLKRKNVSHMSIFSTQTALNFYEKNGFKIQPQKISYGHFTPMLKLLNSAPLEHT